MPFLNEGNVRVSSVVVSDGNHNGYVDLHISGELMLRREAQDVLSQLPVEGVDEVIIRSGEPVLRVVAAGASEPLSYKSLKKLGTAFMRALVSWSAELTSIEVDYFTTCTRQVSATTAYAVHSELHR